MSGMTPGAAIPLEYHPLFHFLVRLYGEPLFGAVEEMTIRFSRPLVSPELRLLERFLDVLGDPPLIIREASATAGEAEDREPQPLLEGQFRTSQVSGSFILKDWEEECPGIELTDAEGRQGFFPLPQGNAAWYYVKTTGKGPED